MADMASSGQLLIPSSLTIRQITQRSHRWTNECTHRHDENTGLYCLIIQSKQIGNHAHIVVRTDDHRDMLTNVYDSSSSSLEIYSEIKYKSAFTTTSAVVG